MNDREKRRDSSTFRRFDQGRAPIRELSKSHQTREGFLLAEGTFAKPGVLTYRDAQGNEFRELVTAKVLRDSLPSIGRKPVTLEHPPMGEDVSPENVKELGVGDVDGTVEFDENGGFVRVKIAVRRADALSAIKHGTHELSPGYDVRLDRTPGVHPEFGRYDAVQTWRDYNHLAITDAARGGPDLQLRADSAVEIRQDQTPTGDDPMDPELHKLLMQLIESGADGRADAIKVLKSHLDATKMQDVERGAVQKLIDQLESKLASTDKALADAVKERDGFAEEMEKIKKDAQKKADSEPSDDEKAEALKQDRLDFARARVPLLTEAAKHEMDEKKLDSMDNDEIVEAIVRKVYGEKVPEDADASYLNASYMHLTSEQHEDSAKPKPSPWDDVGNNRREYTNKQDAADKDELTPSQAMLKSHQDAHNAVFAGK